MNCRMKYNLATYLIDFENVRSDGLRGVNWLSEHDTVVIFYSNNADTLTFEAMDMILNSNAVIRKFKIARGGKNALDFQLATYLGFLIHENTNPYFYIISRDNGFHYVIDFWKRTYRYEGYVFCCASISEAYSKQKRFDSYSQDEKEAIIEELNQEELEQEELEEELEDGASPAEETQPDPASQDASDIQMPLSEPESQDADASLSADVCPASPLASEPADNPPVEPDRQSASAQSAPSMTVMPTDTASADKEPHRDPAEEASKTPTDQTAVALSLSSLYSDMAKTAIVQETAVCAEPEPLFVGETADSSLTESPIREAETPAQEAAPVSDRISEAEAPRSEELSKKGSGRVPSKRQKTPSRRKPKTEKEKPLEETAEASENGAKAKPAPKAKKPNLGELSDDLLLPLSSPTVQKAIALTGDLCRENQAQVAVSHLVHSSGKQDFYRKMTAYFGQKHGIAVYNALRSEYTNIRKNEA